jgi:four helix bundle protein
MDFNDKYRERTKKLAIDIIGFYAKECKKNDELRIIGKQLLRSGTSVAANFRAFTRGRSESEKFSKLCIVVEEADETQFWLELMTDTNLVNQEITIKLTDEITELVKVFTILKSKMKS